MQESLSQILKEISMDKAYEHMEFFVNEVGERLAGTEEIKKAANYIKNEMASYGLEARIDNFPIYHSNPVGSEMKVISPENRIIEAKPACHICSTLPEGIEAELVYVNAGSYEDYEDKDVEGKIVLTRLDLAPRRPEKARIASEKGAKGLIIMNWGPSTGNPVIQMGAVKSQWGNPTPDSFKRIPQIPVISVRRTAGEYLRDLCTQQKVKVWLRAEATREWVLANQPVGNIQGTGSTDEFVLVGGHLEAWGKTAICNASGNSVMLELARVLAKHKDNLNRTVIIAFWDGHEVAEAAGSTWFVDSNWDDLTQRCIAYVNIDNTGIFGTQIPSLIGVVELKDYLENIVQKTWEQKSEWYDIYKGGDQSFFGIGVPYAGFYTRYTPEKLKEYNNAFLSPWLHTPSDTIDKIDKKLYSKHLKFFTVLVANLCNVPLVPYNLVAVAEKLIGDLEKLKSLNKENSVLDLDFLIHRAQNLKAMVVQLTNLANEINSGIKNSSELTADQKAHVGAINRTFIIISRALPTILRSEAGRYGQDPYGYSLVGKPIPALYATLSKIASLSPESEQRYLWETKMLREQNKISDAITNSIDHVEQVLFIMNLQERR
jgi:hypothetical protein